MSSNYEKLKKAFADDPAMLDLLERKETQGILRRLADDLTKKTAVEIAMELKKGDRGEPGYSPVKGKDYFTDEEIGKIAQFIKDSVKEEVRPKKGVDYFDGEDGRNADESEMMKRLKTLIPTVEEIVAKVPVPELPKFDEYSLTQRILSQVPKQPLITVEDLVREIKEKKLLELRDIRGARLDSPKSSGQYLHGGGLTTILNAGTLVTNNMTSLNFTGAGINSITFLDGVVTVDISGGGGGGETLAQTLAIGNVTGGNNIIVSTGDVLKGQTDITMEDSTGDNYYYASSAYIYQQWDGGGGNTDFLLQGGGTQLFSHLSIDIQTDTGLYNFFSGTGTNKNGTFDFTNLTDNRSYAFPDASGTIALLSDIPSVVPAALTKVDDTNVTLTLGGTPSTALLQATSLTLGWSGQLSLARGGTGANLSDPGANAVFVWDDTTNATRLALLSGLSYDSGTNTLTASGSGVSFGTVGQIPYTNAATNDFDYSGQFSFNGSRLLLAGDGTGQVGALHINEGDSVNQYIVLQENAGAPGSVYLTFAGSNPGAMAMGVLFTAGVPVSYVFTDMGGTPLVSIDEATGALNVANLTASELVATDGSKNLQSLAVATYPSLTEIAFVKGVTSSIQTQINTKGAIAGQVWTGVHDFGGATSLEIPNANATVGSTTGLIAIDTTVADFSHGLLEYYSGEVMGVVAMPIAQFTTPSDGFVVAYNATNDEFELVAQGGGVPTTITVANEASDTSCFIAFFTAATGDLGPKTNVNMTFNSSTGVATFASTILTTTDINGGTIDATVIGGVTPAAVTSTIVVVDNITIDLNTISTTSGNLNITPVAGSAIVLDGTISIDAGVVTGITSLGVTGTRVTAGFFTDLTVTNPISGSITGNAATVTVANEATDTSCFIAFFTDASGSLAPKTNVNMTFNSNTGVATFASTILTTTDINGGTIDATVIGGATPAAITGTTIIATTAFNPDTDGGAALGSATLGFSILGLASASTINFANSNVVLTHSSGILTMGTGEMRITSAGTNAASVITQASINSLSNKTLGGGVGNVLGAITMTLGSDADGDIYYRSSGVLTRLAKGTASQLLQMNAGATAPEWATVNIPTVPFFQQDLAPTDLSSLTAAEFCCGSTADGSAFFIKWQGGANIYRFGRDSVTGQYRQTHTGSDGGTIPTGDNGAFIVIGIYLYKFTNDGTNIVCRRWLAADLTGEQVMTVPTVACTTFVAAWTDGVDAYIVSAASNTTSRKWSVSGTTFSAVSTATVTTGVFGVNESSSMWDGTTAYFSTSRTALQKLTNIDGSSRTTTTYLDTLYSDVMVGAFTVNIDSTKMYQGFVYASYDEAGAVSSRIRLIPIVKP